MNNDTPSFAGRRALPMLPRLRNSMSAERRLVWMCRLAREQPGLKPLAFEALLQAQVLVWVDAVASAPDQRQGLGGHQGRGHSRCPTPRDSEHDSKIDRLRGSASIGALLPLAFRKTRYPNGDEAERAAAIFTDLAHFENHVTQQGANQGAHERHCYVPGATCEVLHALAEQGLPLEIDPGSRHRLYLTGTQVQQWLSNWEAGQPKPPASPTGRQFLLWEPHPTLLDRLGAFLAQFEAVGRGWVCQFGDDLMGDGAGPAALGGSEPGTLLLDTMAPEDEERIRRALPLISEGIRLPYRPLGWVATMPRPFAEMPGQRQELLTPVYDRAMSLRPMWRRIA